MTYDEFLATLQPDARVKVEMDLMLYGNAFVHAGKRLDPTKVDIRIVPGQDTQYIDSGDVLTDVKHIRRTQ